MTGELVMIRMSPTSNFNKAIILHPVPQSGERGLGTAKPVKGFNTALKSPTMRIVPLATSSNFCVHWDNVIESNWGGN